MNKTKRTATSALLCALATVITHIGSLLGKIDIATAVVASLCVAVGLAEYGYKNAVCIYLATGLISGLLLPSKTPAVLFTVFFGYYPILKMYFEYTFDIVRAYVLKFAVLDFSIALLVIITVVFFVNLSFWIIAALFVASNLVFPLFDIALSSAMEIYYQKIKKRK